MKPHTHNVLIIDNYDSFTYNIVHALRGLGARVEVVRNDRIDLDGLEEYDKVVVSPGPGIPSEAGLMPQAIARIAGKRPLLGVCLGHQAIAQHFGGTLTNLDHVWHGLATDITVTVPDYMFAGLGSRVTVGRYHSWVVDKDTLPECLEVTAVSDDGAVMALRHRTLDIRGVQFHPESILTPQGMKMLQNWLEQ